MFSSMASVETRNTLNGILPGDGGSKTGHLSRDVMGYSMENRGSVKVGPGTVSDALPQQLCEKLKGLEEFSANVNDQTVDSIKKHSNKNGGIKKSDENARGNATQNNNMVHNRFRSKRQSQHHPPKPGFIKRRRRTVEKVGPTKFLLGGNLHDPLNLNSLFNEIYEKTPATSPLPQLNKDPDPVIIPRDITDPLKLNSVSTDDEEPQLTTTIFSRNFGSGKKKKRLSRDKKEEDNRLCDRNKRRMLELNLDTSSIDRNDRVKDEIVSPVLPETVKCRKRKRVEPTNKIAKALLIETDDVSVPRTDFKKRKISPEKSKYRRQNSKDVNKSKQTPKFKEQNKKFQYGNYTRYYGYRNPEEEDVRLALFRKEWFENKACLDIGCNTGHVTLFVAKHFAPSKITGIDIDSNLIGMARKNVKQCLLNETDLKNVKAKSGASFPTGITSTLGTVKELPTETTEITSTSRFPANVMFRCANFVLEKDEYLSTQKPEYDVIMCLSMTKWVHLNWGDAGLKRMFKRIFCALRPGGQLILEPQGWSSYCKKKKVTETTYKNFFQLELRPEQFKDYLLRDVGFIKCECIGTPLNPSKGFRRPIMMFTKASQGQEVDEDTAGSSCTK